MGFGALTRPGNECLYDEYHGCLKTLQEKIYITPRKVAAALGISNGEVLLAANDGKHGLLDP
ncbi:hypothetical protein AHAS_Ahas01G0135400 [Arachis hypogaea]